MRLLDDWKHLLCKAWSIRLALIAALLSAAEVALPLFPDYFERGTFAALSAITAVAALLARLFAQKTIPRG